MKLCALFLSLFLLMMTVSGTYAEAPMLPYSGYVYIVAGSQSNWYPLAPTAEQSYTVTIRQPLLEGGEMVNVVRITDTAVYMESADCDNQDCVGQGEVTMANRDFRILGNYVICLPHKVQVFLYSPEEFYQWYVSTYPVKE